MVDLIQLDILLLTMPFCIEHQRPHWVWWWHHLSLWWTWSEQVALSTRDKIFYTKVEPAALCPMRIFVLYQQSDIVYLVLAENYPCVIRGAIKSFSCGHVCTILWWVSPVPCPQNLKTSACGATKMTTSTFSHVHLHTFIFHRPSFFLILKRSMLILGDAAVNESWTPW